MSWKQNVAAVAATIISAVAAVLFSSAIAATVDPQSLTALGTSSTTIRLHAYEKQCNVQASTLQCLVISGRCFGFEEEGDTALEFDPRGKLKTARIRFDGSKYAQEKMRAFGATLGRPLEHNGWQTWSLGRESWSFRHEDDGWILIKRQEN